MLLRLPFHGGGSTHFPSRQRRALQLLLLFLSTVVLFLLLSRWEYSRFEAAQRASALSVAVRDGIWDSRVVEKRGNLLPILVPVCARSSHRLQYFKEVLEGLERMEGANETLLVLSVDCPSQRLSSLLKSIATPSNIIILNHKPPWHGIPGPFITNEYATSAHIKFLLGFAFESLKVEAAIVLESDLVPAKDFYRYHQQTSHLFQTHSPSSLPLLSIHSFHSPSLPTSSSRSLFSGPFCSWGWSTSSSTWPALKSKWSWINWDISIRRVFGSGPGGDDASMISLVPERSRVRMVGLQGINVKEEAGSAHAKEWESIWTGDDEEGSGIGQKVGEGVEGDETATGRETQIEKPAWVIYWNWRKR